MPHVTFVYPAIEDAIPASRVRARPLYPLAIAALAALTPPAWERRFFDDRIEKIQFDLATDLVAISVETYTAKRAYQIAAEYRRRGVRVVMGGYHATLCSEEVLQHADAICLGDAEPVWSRILEDLSRGCLGGRYGPEYGSLQSIRYDRSIFAGKRYLRIGLIETGKGCPYHCSYCSVTAFHRGHYRARPVEEVAREFRGLREKLIHIVDDNVAEDPHHARKLFQALAGSGKHWIGQATVSLGRDPELLDLLAASGCAGLLLGFDSLSAEAIASLDKTVNLKHGYETAIAELRKRGIAVYGTFMLGLPSDTEESVRATTRFAVDQKLFLAAFNHVVPFPGTPLYTRLQEAGRLLRPTWWLDGPERFVEVPFEPWCAGPGQVREWCREARRTVYGWPALLRRGSDLQANCRSFRKAAMFLLINVLLRREFFGKQTFAMGVRTARGTEVPPLR